MLVNLHTVNAQEWVKDSSNVYIGRQTKVLPASKWHNPFRISRNNTREEVVEKFEQYLKNNRELLSDLHHLKGKTLGCWCHPEACHGNVIQKLLQQHINMEGGMASAANSATFNPEVLDKMKKAELVELVMQLQVEKNTIKEELESLQVISSRVIELERSQYLYEQYGRRESVEITGIPPTVKIEDLEDAVIDVYNKAEVKVFGRELEKEDISACHRIGKKKEVTIVRFVNRKWAWQGLICGKNLKGKSRNPLYINNSFCPEFAKYGYFIRRLKPQLAGYRVRHGVYQIQLVKDGDFLEISHSSDFAKHGLDIKPFQN